MAMAALSHILRVNTIKAVTLSFARSLSVQQTVTSGYLPVHLTSSTGDSAWLWQRRDALKLPVSNVNSLNLPSGMMWVPHIEEPERNSTETSIELPTSFDVDNIKQAARLIVIRRKKMKKHKLRKFRKRMKFENAKRRQRRESRKEKDFQAELVQQCKVAEAFSAEDYVNERLERLKEVTTPKRWVAYQWPRVLMSRQTNVPPKN